MWKFRQTFSGTLRRFMHIFVMYQNTQSDKSDWNLQLKSREKLLICLQNESSLKSQESKAGILIRKLSWHRWLLTDCPPFISKVKGGGGVGGAISLQSGWGYSLVCSSDQQLFTLTFTPGVNVEWTVNIIEGKLQYLEIPHIQGGGAAGGRGVMVTFFCCSSCRNTSRSTRSRSRLVNRF